jgi:hypothetical protein
MSDQVGGAGYYPTRVMNNVILKYFSSQKYINTHQFMYDVYQ